MFTQEGTCVCDHKASHMYKHKFLCNFTHESPLVCLGKSTVHRHSHMWEGLHMQSCSQARVYVYVHKIMLYTSIGTHIQYQ